MHRRRCALVLWLLVAPQAAASACSFIGDWFRAAIGRDRLTQHVRTTPVLLSVEINTSTAQVIIARNTSIPVRRSVMFEQSTDERHSGVVVRVLAGAHESDGSYYELGSFEANLGAVGGCSGQIQATLEVDDASGMTLSLHDAGAGRLCLKTQVHNYRRLASLFAPIEAELRDATALADSLQVSLAGEEDKALELSSKVASLEHDLAAQGKDLWTALRESSQIERVAEQQAARMKKERAEYKKCRASSGAAEDLKEALEAAKADANLLHVQVDRQAAELEERGRDLWSCLQDATRGEMGAQTMLEAERASARVAISMKASELEVTRAAAWWWSSIASVAALALSAAVFQAGCARRRADAVENLDDNEAKRERRKLLRLLARVRQATGETPPESQDSKARGPSAASLLDRFRGAARVGKGQGCGDQACVFRCTEQSAGRDLRRVRVESPGVAPGDVQIEVLFNGAEIRFSRETLPGTRTVVWSHRVEFKVEDGHFEFQDQEARLEHGTLHLTFRAKPVPRRIFRFPEHFDMSYADLDPDQELYVQPNMSSKGVAPCGGA